MTTVAAPARIDRSIWPRRLPRTIGIPETNLAHNLATSAARYPAKDAIVYYDSPITYAELWRDVEALAGYLQRECGVRRGDRVVLYMQNSPQFITAFYAILRADAAVVPLNPMLVGDELPKYVADAGARVAVVGQELLERVAPMLGQTLDRVVACAYGEALVRETAMTIPPAVSAPPLPLAHAGAIALRDVLALAIVPQPMVAGADDIAVLPYTSGTTGKPKGCVHTHRSAQTTTMSSLHWGNVTSGTVQLSTLPLFHVTGMTIDMSAALSAGATIVMTTRWDASAVLDLVSRYRVTHWTAIVTMVIDLLSQPNIDASALSSLQLCNGGGAALPGPISDRLFELTGLRYMEGYGLSETLSITHANPPDRTKAQCLGVPCFGVDSRIIDPDTLREVGTGETGEIVIHGTQIMREYWQQPETSAEAFLELDGKRFLRTGDLGYVDDEGYFFMVDRLKRMINASGFKVWPAEVEAHLFAHPAVREACVVGTVDARRGETTKVFVVAHEGAAVTHADIIGFAKERMANYKVPTAVEFVASLPRTATGKVDWRTLQDRELGRTSG